MPRVKIELPDQFPFSIEIPVRITDLNYGGHVGNDRIPAYMQEARVAFLNKYGYSELDVEGVSLIMSDCQIVFKGEGFYGDIISIEVAAVEFHKYGFNLYYRMQKQSGQLVAEASSNMMCFDYKNRKLLSLPEQAKLKLEQGRW